MKDTVVIKHIENKPVLVRTDALNDTRLSWAAKGVYLAIDALNLEDEEQLKAISKDDELEEVLKELIYFGYIEEA